MMSSQNKVLALARSRWAPILALLAVALVVGWLVADDYGISTDEQRNYTVGFDSLQSYLSPTRYQDYLEQGEPLAHHGPSYFMVFAVLARAFAAFNPQWQISDGRHLANYLTYLLGVVSFYFIAARVVPRRYAWMATALFATQPLLFGHAFINQKDTPFLGFFLASVAAGLAIADGVATTLLAEAEGAGREISWRRIRGEWSTAAVGARLVAILYLVAVLLWTLDILGVGEGRFGLQVIAQQAHEGRAWPPLQQAVEALAPGVLQAPANVYAGTGAWIHDLGRVVVMVVLVMLGPLMARWVLPGCTRDVGGRFGKWIALVALGGALLGFTISIRQVGALAGLLVSLYWVYRMRGRGVWLLGVYWAAAACVTLATWPYLWASPVLRFWESLTVAADFEIHMTPYRGDWVFSDRLPWHYFPTLASLELTEPAVALFLGGVGVAIWRWVKHDINPCMIIILVLWLGIPLFALIGMGMGAYNNIRQLHFVLVPVFLIAGIGLAALLAAVKVAWIETLLFLLLLLPGVIGIVKLHPFEYTYFNALAGGLEGAQGQYAQDYWCTSYREAMAYVNEVAEPGAKVMAMGPLRSALSFAREDLVVLRNEGDRSVRGVDYLLTCYRWLGMEWDAKAGLERVHTVSRGSAVFAEVFRRADVTPGASE